MSLRRTVPFTLQIFLSISAKSGHRIMANTTAAGDSHDDVSDSDNDELRNGGDAATGAAASSMEYTSDDTSAVATEAGEAAAGTPHACTLQYCSQHRWTLTIFHCVVRGLYDWCINVSMSIRFQKRCAPKQPRVSVQILLHKKSSCVGCVFD